MLWLLRFIVDNYKIILFILLLLFLLSLIRPITLMINEAKEGIKLSFTPTGFIVLIILIFLTFFIYAKAKGLTS